ncbi:MAG: hypothetical protein HY720_13765 [Planctomycetes bacterium]|nr:hypothetical protein [Planctomycetota bacterium]
MLVLVAGCAGRSGVSLDPGGAAPATPTGIFASEDLAVDETELPPLSAEEEDVLLEAIQGLASPHFAVYTASAATVIGFGERALPILVRDAQAERTDFGVRSRAVPPVIHRILEEVPTPRLVAYLRWRSGDARRSAAIHLGERKEAGAVPHLLATLPPSPASLRLRYFEALREITAIPDRDPEDWEGASPELVEAWEEWWRGRNAPAAAP